MNTNREAWLTQAVDALSPLFAEQGHTVPQVRVAVGWPHGGRPNTIGQCWPGVTAADGVGQIFISPVLSDATKVLAVLVHELVHAVNHMNHETGHGKEFSRIAKPLGLEGRMTATTAGEALQARLERIAEELGEFPHAALSRRPKDATRSGKTIKVACPVNDDFFVSMSRARINDYGYPLCPCHGDEMVEV